MIYNVVDQGVDGLLSTQNRLHLAQFLFALFDDIRISILSHDVILLINQVQCAFIQFEMNDSALIVDRPCRSIFHSLRHIVNVDIIAENLAGAPILR